MSFKLGVDGGGGSGATGGTDDALNDGGGAGSGMMLHGGGGGGGGGDDEAATESRLRRWPGDEETSIKEPTWRPLDIDYIHSSSSSKRAPPKDKPATPDSPAPPPPANYFKNKPDDNAAAASAASAGAVNYKLFSELEAIYKPGSGGAQTGSGSGLTGDDNAMLAPPMADLPDAAAANPPHLNTSETSAGEDAHAVVQPQPQTQQPSGADAARRKRKRRRQEQLSASASFFERLVQRLMEHQESLHRQFLDTVQRRWRGPAPLHASPPSSPTWKRSPARPSRSHPPPPTPLRAPTSRTAWGRRWWRTTARGRCS